MSIASNFYKKVLSAPELAQVSVRVAVLDRYLGMSGAEVTRTDSVGRIKTASWMLDFGIAPDENSVHVPVAALERVPENERTHWLEHLEDGAWSQNFLKMQSAHSCIDDGTFRAWGEEPLF